MRAGLTMGLAALFCAGTSAAWADDKCPPLLQINTIQMTRAATANADFVPFAFGDTQKQFLLDTGGYYTQLRRATAEELKLPIHQGKRGIIDVNGNMSRDEVTVPT